MFFIIIDNIVLLFKNISLIVYLEISRIIYVNIENHPHITSKQISFIQCCCIVLISWSKWKHRRGLKHNPLGRLLSGINKRDDVIYVY